MIATDTLYIALKSQREVLNDIHNPDCNLAIWTRQPNADIVQFLKQVEHDEIHLCQTISADKVSAYLRRNLRPFADETGKSAFIDDVSEVAKFFAQLTNANRLHFHLETIRTDQCRKFHRDFYPLRLLCTYIGKGTEYLENDNVNREGKTNEEIVRDWQRVRRLNAFDVAILKGEAPGNEGNAIFHRSPEIEATNDFRVLLRIDV